MVHAFSIFLKNIKMTKLNLHRLLILFFMGCTMCALQACSDSNEEEVLSDLVGTWYRYLQKGNHEEEQTYTFNSDGTGTGEKSSSTGSAWSEERYSFAYTVNGKIIRCEGYVYKESSYDGVESGSWSATFTYEKGKLKIGEYNYNKI